MTRGRSARLEESPNRSFRTPVLQTGEKPMKSESRSKREPESVKKDYQPPKVESVKLSPEAAEALT